MQNKSGGENRNDGPDQQRVKPGPGEEQPQEEQDLDEAIADTFPASDPVSVEEKGEPTAPSNPRK